MSRALFATLLVSATVWAGTPKYPFPTLSNYPYGKRFIPTSGYDPIPDIIEKFEAWDKKYYESCPDASKGGRIKWDDTKAESVGCANGQCTVSEGIGYGMLIYVYMDNAKYNTQEKFDKLWKYYQNFGGSTNGVMDWQIDGCNGKKGDGGGATDAEIDVAFSLLIAYKQWGNESYLTDAKKLINAIWTKEVDQNAKVLKPGSNFGSPFNPSYFGTGVLRLFQEVDPSHDWNAIANGCIAFAKQCQNPSTGLVPDWCSNGSSVDYNGSGANKYGYDAVRTPWRITLDYLWFGTKSAKEFLAPITPWISKATNNAPMSIRAEYNTNGSTSVTNWSDAVTSGSLIIPAMTDSTNTTWLRNASWDRVNEPSVSDHNYYNASWQIIYELTLLGGLQNFHGKMYSVAPRVRSEKRWETRVTSGSIFLTGPGLVEVDLVDPIGKIVSRASGSNSITLRAPRSGLYFAKISGHQMQTTPLVVP